MNGKRIVALAWKEWREIVRDRLFFALAFIVPTMLMLLFGFGLSLDVEHLPFAVVDYDRSAASRDYAYRFISSRYFDFKGYAGDARALDSLLADNRIRMALVIPQRFDEHLARGEPAPVQVLIDGTFPMRTQTTQGYVVAINSAVSLDNMARALSAGRGIPLDEARRRVQPVKLEVRYLYNQSVKSIWSLAPKLIMLIMMLSPPFLTALGVVREKESGSIFNIYSSTVSPGEFLLGKLAPYVFISIANAMVLWALAVWLYDAPFKGDPFFFAFATLLYVICTTGIGLVISMLVQTQVAAMIVASIVSIIPAVLYSGMLLPLTSLSPSASAIAHALPTMYYTNIVVGSFLKGVSWERPVARRAGAGGLRRQPVRAGLPAVFQAAKVMKNGFFSLAGLRRLRVMTWKELLQLFRDTALMVFFLYSFTGDIYIAASGVSMQLKNAAIATLDGDRSDASRELLSRFQPPYFRPIGELAAARDSITLLDDAGAMAVLDIPPRFQERLQRGEQVSVQLQVDTTNSVLGFLASSYGAQIVGKYGLEAAAQREGLGGMAGPVLQADTRIWYNPNQNDAWFMGISELLTVVTLFAILLPAAAMVREKERGTIEQLMVTPLSAFQILFPKVIAMTLVILGGSAIALFGILGPVFHVPMRGSLLTFFLITALYVFTTAGLGLLAATVARNLAQVGMLTVVILMPMLLLSGAWTPPEAMPDWMRILAYISPLHYFLDAAYGILLKGAGMDLLWDSVLAMGTLGLAVFALGMRRFGRQFG